MEINEKQFQAELNDLKDEIERFKKEKERVRIIVGKIGGMPTFNTRAFNIFFFIFVIVCLGISLMSGGFIQLVMVELAVAAVSMKLIYLMHSQHRVNHFQLWILSSIEWRLNELRKEVQALKER